MYGPGNVGFRNPGGTGYAGDDRGDKKQREVGRRQALTKEAHRSEARHRLLSNQAQSPSVAPTDDVMIALRQTLRNFGVVAGGTRPPGSAAKEKKILSLALQILKDVMTNHPSMLGDLYGKDDSLVLALQDSAKTAQLKVDHHDGSSKEELKVAKQLIELFSAVKSVCLRLHQAPDILVTDSKENYRESMRQFAFAFCDNFQRHFFLQPNAPFLTQSTMTAAQRKRLFQELSSYQTNLPIEFGSSILVRAMEGRMDQVRVLIFGPEDTPYANGCFFFDLFLSDYPRQPPKCQFLTTGGGKYRLNPNLYNCGKVCLSLLGTWSGPSWQPNESTLYQLLISIQSLILGESEPYFNEPGGETTRHIPAEQEASAAYNGEIREYTCAAAILPFLKASKEQHPYPEFQEAIDLHFRLKQSVILRQLEEWSKGIHPDRKIGGGQRGTKVTTHEPTPTLYIAQCLEVLKTKVASFDRHGDDEVVLVEPVARLPPSLNKKRSRNAAKGKIHEVITLDDDGAFDTKQPAQCKRVARMPIEADKKRPATKTTVISLDEDESEVDQTGIESNPNQKQAKSPSQPDIILLDDD